MKGLSVPRVQAEPHKHPKDTWNPHSDFLCKNTDECFICWFDVFFNFTLEKNANFMPKSAESCIYQHFTTYDAFYTSGITKE